MKKIQMMIAALLVATGFAASAQNENPKLIAVINRANWCAVCKANADRFGATIMPYTAKGVTVLMNDLTNDTTIAASNSMLQNAGLYKAVYAVPRKGMGKMLQSCGLVKGKTNKTLPSGIVTFINPNTHQPLKQLSIAVSNEEMRNTIDGLLNNR